MIRVVAGYTEGADVAGEHGEFAGERTSLADQFVAVEAAIKASGRSIRRSRRG